ncbi:MAG: hypothetical protein QM496_10675 [Verrucomicrobiota bacterium]
MKVISAVAVSLVFILNGPTAFAADSSNPRKESVIELESNEIGVKIFVPQNSKDGSCKIQIKVANISASLVTVIEPNMILSCKVGLIDSNGIVCPFTKRGAIVFGDGIKVGYSSRVHAFRKGESKTFEIELYDYFILQPGDWTMRFSMKVISAFKEGDAARATTFKAKGLKISILSD